MFVLNQAQFRRFEIVLKHSGKMLLQYVSIVLLFSGLSGSNAHSETEGKPQIDRGFVRQKNSEQPGEKAPKSSSIKKPTSGANSKEKKVELKESGNSSKPLLKGTSETAPKVPEVSSLQISEEIIPTPFWKAKPEVYKKICDEKAIVVSARTETSKVQSAAAESTTETSASKTEITEKKKEELRVTAAGHIVAPMAFVIKTIQQYEELPKVDSRFVEVRNFPERNRIFLHMAAYGYHTSMILQLRTGQTEKAFEIQWESVEGGFLGMRGVIRLDRFREGVTEMSLSGYYETNKLPLPSILMGFGLEIVARQVADKMRKFIQDSYELTAKKIQ